MSDRMYGFDYSSTSVPGTRMVLQQEGFDTAAFHLTERENVVRVEHPRQQVALAVYRALQTRGRCSNVTIPGVPGADAERPYEVLVRLTPAEYANLAMAAAYLREGLGEVLAVLAGRVQVESGGRLRLAGEEQA